MSILRFAGESFCLDSARIIQLKQQHNEYEHEQQLPPRTKQSEIDLIDEIDRLLPFRYGQEMFAFSTYYGRKLGSIASQYNDFNFPACQIRIGDWYYPVGLSRWSVFRGLATSTQVSKMIEQTMGSSPALFEMQVAPIGRQVSDYLVSTNMRILPPRLLGEYGGQYDGLYLVTLIDDRYYFQFNPVTIKITYNMTWANLVDQLADDLDITIDKGAISSSFSLPEPDSQLWSCSENPAYLLDAIAYNVGKVIVRNLDGTYKMITYAESSIIAEANRTNLMKFGRVLGGPFFSSGSNLYSNRKDSRNSILPATVQMNFPKYIIGNDPVPHFYNDRYSNPRPSTWYEDSYGGIYSINVPIASGGVSISGQVGVGTHFVYSTAKALFSGEINATLQSGQTELNPLNKSGLMSLSLDTAKTHYEAVSLQTINEAFPGTFKLVLEGLHDVIWSISSRNRESTTRLVPREWNRSVKEYQHATPSISGLSHIPAGVGGHSVSQTIRDSDCVYVSGSISSTLISGGFGVTFNSIGNFPTNERWKGKVEDELILFEGTSGGISGNHVGIVQRGIDGTLQKNHNNGSVVLWNVPNTTYGVNLTTYKRGQYVFPSDHRSGGVHGVNVVPQTQSVFMFSASGVNINSITYYSGAYFVFDTTKTSGQQFVQEELIWIAERTGKYVLSGHFYNGQFVGYSDDDSGKVAPIYVVDEHQSTELIRLTGLTGPEGLLDAYIQVWNPLTRTLVDDEQIWAFDANTE